MKDKKPSLKLNRLLFRKKGRFWDKAVHPAPETRPKQRKSGEGPLDQSPRIRESKDPGIKSDLQNKETPEMGYFVEFGIFKTARS